jgi:predicted transcriptional regulator
MIRAPHAAFKPLSLLELKLGLYDAAYRSLLNGSRLIAVDPDRPAAVQRAAMARELYVAFCRSKRADELEWPDRKASRHRSDYFARCLLMPAAWVKHVAVGSLTLEELAVIFGVSTQMMADRLRELGIE